MDKVPFPERFLQALEAAAPDTRYEKICDGIGFGADLVDTWRQTTRGFRQRFDELTVDGRRGPIADELLVERLRRYVTELGLGFTDDSKIDRAAAAARAGVKLSDVVRYTDKSSSSFSEEFHELEEEILLQQTVKVEDAAATLATKSAEEAKKDGWDYRQLTPMTSYLKSRSRRHQEQRVVVEGEVKHSHQLTQGLQVMRELSTVRARFEVPPTATLMDWSGNTIEVEARAKPVIVKAAS